MSVENEQTKTLELAQVIAKGRAAMQGPTKMDRRRAEDPKFGAILLATKVPDAGGDLAEIHDPHVRAKVADALDLSERVKNAPALFNLARVLAKLGYHNSSDKVRKQAEYIARTYPNGPW